MKIQRKVSSAKKSRKRERKSVLFGEIDWTSFPRAPFVAASAKSQTSPDSVPDKPTIAIAIYCIEYIVRRNSQCLENCEIITYFMKLYISRWIYIFNWTFHDWEIWRKLCQIEVILTTFGTRHILNNVVIHSVHLENCEITLLHAIRVI